jgi:hypothetical protein
MITDASVIVAATKHKRVAKMTPEEEERILKNKADIAAGKSRRFKSISEYIKSLEEDT